MKNTVILGLLSAYFGLSGVACNLDNNQPQNVVEQPIKPKETVKPKISDPLEDRLRETIISYASQPGFSGSNFLGQITRTSVKLEMYDIDEERLYVSIPVSKYSDKILPKLSKNPKEVAFGQTPDNKFTGNSLVLGQYTFNKPGYYFFSFPKSDLKVDKKAKLSFKFNTATYTVNLNELTKFVEDKSVYGGNIVFPSGRTVNGLKELIPNFGALVAKKDEKSLERFVGTLVRKDEPKEVKAQVLLDFVTYNIKYDYEEANSGLEVLKRPNEVLMTRSSVCKGLAVLYASLLEQANVDYKLLYLPGHVTVAVEGNYPNANGLTFDFGGKNYSIAEPTNHNFKIGSTLLKWKIQVSDIEYFQRPSPNSRIYDAKTGRPLG